MSQSPVSSEPLFNTVAVVGVGLIGGSLAAAVKTRGVARRVIGVGRNPERLEAAKRDGLVDEITVDLPAAAAKSDLMIFCTPVDKIVAGVREAASRCRPGTIITDAGSVKAEICRELAEGLPDGVEFVGSHPLAGSEKQGFEYANANLFEDRICIVTQRPENTLDSIERIVRFWMSLGAQINCMCPETHDMALAETSHLPHVVAAALSVKLSYSRFAATGFRDTTRIASGDPDLWTAILLQNAEEVLNSLEKFEGSLSDFRNAIGKRDSAGLRALLTKAKSNRDGLNGNSTL